MKNKFLKGAIARLVLSACCCVNIANAGLIINTTNDSFIDDTTGLEWMDFGVNNHLSYNQVVAQLGTTFRGWRLANEKEALDLWSNAFSGKGSEFDIKYPTGEYYAAYSDGSNKELHFDVMATMGYDRTDFGRSYYGSLVGQSFGYFVNITGGLSYVYKEGHQNGESENHVYGRGKTYRYYDFTTIGRGTTMLVKKVPEPSTLAIFALALMGLSSRRFK